MGAGVLVDVTVGAGVSVTVVGMGESVDVGNDADVAVSAGIDNTGVGREQLTRKILMMIKQKYFICCLYLLFSSQILPLRSLRPVRFSLFFLFSMTKIYQIPEFIHIEKTSEKKQ